jgi:AraC family transcriptional regulator, regulatory protein of adaptative response / methylated-DNA-[protein]-cysteine methyltransferase
LAAAKSSSTLSLDEMWDATRRRDGAFDGVFFYGVRSTGVYCIPSCPSRRPRPDQVRFFSSRAEAVNLGFRACRRCRPDAADPIVSKVKAICDHIDSHPGESLTLDALGRTFQVSPFHLQRSFKRIVGLTPRQYAEGARLRSLRRDLKKGSSVRQSTYDVGRSSTGWLYERGESKLGMHASAYKSGGLGRRIYFSLVPCSLGRLLVAGTEDGVCMVGIGDSDESMVAALKTEYPNGTLLREDERVSAWVGTIVGYLEGRGDGRMRRLPLGIQATAFQLSVWNELRAIPAGSISTYSEIADRIGRPEAVRAVARACATNPVALVIPCHRVVGKDGSMRGYRWGVERKKALLRIEGAPLAESEG